MDIYEFYETEKKKFDKAKMEPERLRECLQNLFKVSVKEMYDWAMPIIEHLPERAYEFMKEVITEEFEYGYEQSDFRIEIYDDSISFATSEGFINYETEDRFSEANYLAFKEISHCDFSLSIFPDRRNFVQINILEENYNRKYLEKQILYEILQTSYGYGTTKIDKDEDTWIITINNFSGFYS